MHILPHWNWAAGDTVDVVAYYNNADQVELFLNDQSLGVRSKADSSLHVRWRVPFRPGELKAISSKAGSQVKVSRVLTAGPAAVLQLVTEQNTIPGEERLAFIQARLCDEQGNLLPMADDLVEFHVEGDGELLATDNGSPVDVSDFSSSNRNLLNGKALVIVRSKVANGSVRVSAKIKDLAEAKVDLIINTASSPEN
ncbi:MAG: DUF4982 domain-containing protein [Sphingobacterium sp.]